MSNLFSRYFSNGVDYIEEQQNEIEALRAIYYDEFQGTSFYLSQSSVFR